MADESARSTVGEDYAQRLVRLQNAPWKRLLRVQAVFLSLIHI